MEEHVLVEGMSNFNRTVLKSGGFRMKLYEAATRLGTLLARIPAMKNQKMRDALNGRSKGIRGWTISKSDDKPVVMIHVASAGEYEGARALIDRLIEKDEVRIAVSFSSPSAKSPVESTEGLYAFGFLPMDYLIDQLQLLARLDPVVVLIFKHDFWPNLLRAASALKIPIGLINANFHAKSKRNFPVIKGFHKLFMKHLTFIWTVSEADSVRIEPLLTGRIELAVGGDTRYDRVLRRAELGQERFESLMEALGESKVIIAGSSWPPGEKIVYGAFANLRKQHPELKLLIAPHEPTAEALQRNIDAAKSIGTSVIKLSQWQGENIEADAILVDGMGILADIYAVGWAAYVGGGFGQGVHSVIEPAAHGSPVAFGPNHHVSHEAGLLVKNGGGYVVETATDLENLWGKWLDDPGEYDRASNAALEVVTDHAGVTEKLMERLELYLGNGK